MSHLKLIYAVKSVPKLKVIKGGNNMNSDTDNSPIIIETKEVKSHGLSVWEVKVNGTVLSTHLSKELADSKKQACIYAWNIERIGQIKRQRTGA